MEQKSGEEARRRYEGSRAGLLLGISARNALSLGVSGRRECAATLPSTPSAMKMKRCGGMA